MIPDWNNHGVLPPTAPGMSAQSRERSPYRVNIHDIIETFGFSEQRDRILKGLLDFRQALYGIGIVQGFQWINGSFTENIEALENRGPNDLDVVTFFHLPYGMDQKTLIYQHSSVFIPEETKRTYMIDGYTCLLGEPTEKRHVREISYWYSMWSHRRDGLWKGFLQIDLTPREDGLALQILQAKGLK